MHPLRRLPQRLPGLRRGRRPCLRQPLLRAHRRRGDAALVRLEAYEALPHASSLCGACRDICPVRIDLPRMLVELRRDEEAARIPPWSVRWMEAAAAFVLKSPRRLRLATALLRLAQRPFVGSRGLRLPARLNPAGERSLPALAPRSFRRMWASGELEEETAHERG